MYAVYIEFQLFSSARGQVLNKNVRLLQHLPHQLAVAAITNIQTDRLFAMIQPNEIGTFTIDECVVATCKVAFRSFDFNYPGTSLCQFP